MKRIKITAIAKNGATITSGWFNNVTMGEEYANVMTARGMVVVKQYR